MINFHGRTDIVIYVVTSLLKSRLVVRSTYLDQQWDVHTIMFKLRTERKTKTLLNMQNRVPFYLLGLMHLKKSTLISVVCGKRVFGGFNITLKYEIPKTCLQFPTNPKRFSSPWWIAVNATAINKWAYLYIL